MANVAEVSAYLISLGLGPLAAVSPPWKILKGTYSLIMRASGHLSQLRYVPL